MNSAIMSIYIPRMCINTCEHEIRQAFVSSGIGSVSRVDFNPIDKKPGFVENITEETAVKSAFVHFNWFYESANHILDRLKAGESYRLLLNSRDEKNGYWILLKATNPAQSTMMNNHQIVDNCRHLQRIIEAQQKQIEEQQKQIEKLTNTTMRVRDEVYQLFGGLFNQTTQREALNYHIGMLGIELDEGSKVTGEIKCNIWPTTRQGDEHEKRLDNMDAVIRQIIGGVYCQRTQAGIIQNHMDILDGREFKYNNRGQPIVDYPKETHKHEYWPTTRQGDDLEKRLQRVEDELGIKNYEQSEFYHSDDEDHPLLATCDNVTLTRGSAI